MRETCRMAIRVITVFMLFSCQTRCEICIRERAPPQVMLNKQECQELVFVSSDEEEEGLQLTGGQAQAEDLADDLGIAQKFKEMVRRVCKYIQQQTTTTTSMAIVVRKVPHDPYLSLQLAG